MAYVDWAVQVACRSHRGCNIKATVNICGKQIDLMQFLREKVMARGKSDNSNLR